MTQAKGVIITGLIAAMKKAGFATKTDLKAFATKTDIQDELADFYQGHIKPEMKRTFDKLRGEMINGFKHASAERTEIKRQINELKADTPTQREVNDLTTRVTRLESFHRH